MQKALWLVFKRNAMCKDMRVSFVRRIMRYARALRPNRTVVVELCQLFYVTMHKLMAELKSWSWTYRTMHNFNLCPVYLWKHTTTRYNRNASYRTWRVYEATRVKIRRLK